MCVRECVYGGGGPSTWQQSSPQTESAFWECNPEWTNLKMSPLRFCLQPIHIFSETMTPQPHLFLKPRALTLPTTAAPMADYSFVFVLQKLCLFTLHLKHMLHVCSVFGVFLWLYYSATYRPGIYTTVFSVVSREHIFLSCLQNEKQIYCFRLCVGKALVKP